MPFSTNNAPSNILAFRMITTMLALIQQNQPFQLGHQPKYSAEEALELKLSNAFATLAVTFREVVAVFTNFDPSHLEVIVSADLSDQKGLLNAELQPPPGILTKIEKMWNIIFTKNYHRHDKLAVPGASPATMPIIIEPTIPSELKSKASSKNIIPEEALKIYLNKLNLHG